ncbi:MAG: hypothetical protein AAF722_10100 [Cyanobacteria bacterium P01_C01_bin.70]
MFVSTFELLLNASQLPREVQGVPASALEVFEPISRDVLQGYFLTISNLENREVILQFLFTVVSSPGEDVFSNSTVGSFFDSTGVNTQLSFNSPTPKTHSIILTFKPHDTGLLLVQPDPFLLPKPLDTSEIEIRGYVEVKNLQSCDKGFGITRVLLTPEHRGTFYNLEVPKDSHGNIERDKPVTLSKEQQLDQIAYSLPTGPGKALFELG